MKILIDMNLSPEWVQALTTAGIESVHWSTIGSPSAPDREIMNWALIAVSASIFTDLGNQEPPKKPMSAAFLLPVPCPLFPIP